MNHEKFEQPQQPKPPQSEGELVRKAWEEEQKPDYESMNFSQLEADTVAGPILQQKALEYLKTRDREYFERNFTGELDAEGYLIPKEGSRAGPNTKPSMNFSGEGMEWIEEETKKELRNRAEK